MYFTIKDTGIIEAVEKMSRNLYSQTHIRARYEIRCGVPRLFPSTSVGLPLIG